MLCVISEVFGLSNSPYSIPWQKVERGKDQFAEIVGDHPAVTSKDKLTSDLIAFLNDTTQ